ncbi:MAG: protein kinase, partial [Planctomycetota bacterium]|nr:protein kinase [Planctomycetota bacterium]
MNTNPTVDAVQLNETAAADPDRDLVDVLAEVYAQRLRNREDPAIREYSEMFPEQAGEIWDAFPAVAWLEGALSPLGAAFTSESQATMAAGAGDISVGISPPRTGTPDSIGDFRIVREIGRGGMGVVYEAVQQSLGRTVALKVLPPSINLSESQIGRFHREAQSAGRLHHTNIVPVFGVGEHDGMHYYVMQCIQGQGLDSILNSFHVVEGAFVSTNQTTEGNTGPSNTAVNEKSKSGSTTE